MRGASTQPTFVRIIGVPNKIIEPHIAAPVHKNNISCCYYWDFVNENICVPDLN
jgi:hypothetical protein